MLMPQGRKPANSHVCFRNSQRCVVIDVIGFKFSTLKASNLEMQCSVFDVQNMPESELRSLKP